MAKEEEKKPETQVAATQQTQVVKKEKTQSERFTDMVVKEFGSVGEIARRTTDRIYQQDI